MGRDGGIRVREGKILKSGAVSPAGKRRRGEGRREKRSTMKSFDSQPYGQMQRGTRGYSDQP